MRRSTENRLARIQNLVFQGGGVKGAAYLGCVEIFFNPAETHHMQLTQIQRVCGASAGAITAFLIALGNNVEQLDAIIKKQKFVDFLDTGGVVSGVSFKDATLRLNGLIKIAMDNKSSEDEDVFTVFNLVLFIIFNYVLDKIGGYAADKFEEYLLSKIGTLYSIFESLVGYIDNMIGQRASAFIKKMLTYGKEFLIDKLLGFVTDVKEFKKKLMLYFGDENQFNNYFKCVNALIEEIITKRGIFAGNMLLNWLAEQLESIKIDGRPLSRDTTFYEFFEVKQRYPQLQLKDLYIVALNLSVGLTQIFSYDKTPNIPIIDAVRISMSIPFFFKPYYIREKTREQFVLLDDLYTDGGVLDNYPIWVFDQEKYISGRSATGDTVRQNPRTLGMRLVTEEIKRLHENSEDIPKSESFLIAYINLGSKNVDDLDVAEEFKRRNQKKHAYIFIQGNGDYRLYYYGKLKEIQPIEINGLEGLGEKLKQCRHVDCEDVEIRRILKNYHDGIGHYGTALISAYLNSQENIHYHSGNRHRTVYVDTKDIGTVDFSLGSRGIESLTASGRQAALDYLERLFASKPRVSKVSSSPISMMWDESFGSDIGGSFRLRKDLVQACEEGDLQRVRRLVETKKIDPMSPVDGVYPLGAAIWGLNPDVVNYLDSKIAPDAGYVQRCRDANYSRYGFLTPEFKPINQVTFSDLANYYSGGKGQQVLFSDWLWVKDGRKSGALHQIVVLPRNQIRTIDRSRKSYDSPATSLVHKRKILQGRRRYVHYGPFCERYKKCLAYKRQVENVVESRLSPMPAPT